MEQVGLVGGCRTPFVKAAGAFAKHTFVDLGVHSVRSLVRKLAIDPVLIDELIYSTVLFDPRIPNFAREIGFRAGLPGTVVAHSLSSNCISGLVCANTVYEGIRCGRIKSGIAGGSESMSAPTLTYHPKAEKLFFDLFRAKTLGQKAKILSGLRPKLLMPQAPSPKEPATGLTMGEHCEITAKEFHISREVQDEIALRSHVRAAEAQRSGRFAEEIVAFGTVAQDNLVRGDTSKEKLASLKPVFDRSGAGTLTAGNSSALTDGSSAVCLMSESFARETGKEVLAFVEAIEFSAINPSQGLLMAPALALPKVMERAGLKVDDIAIFEIHEAFGAQVAANLKVWEEGWSEFPQLRPIGRIPVEKINVNGGSIAVGHPFAATGGRLMMAAANELRRSNQRYAAISVCAAGAMACAMILRNPSA